MPHHYSYPGVYIEEQPAAGAIQPIGTSTAAFIGAARNGPTNEPVFLTSFDQFQETFDSRPMDGFYLWYAVRGFFENGGQRAYIVRATTGSYAETNLVDSRTTGAQPALVVRSRQLGASGLTVTVTHTSLVNTTAFNPKEPIETGDPDSTEIEIGPAGDPDAAREAAAQFRAGDQILVADQRLTVQRVTGPTITTEESLDADYAGQTVRLPDLQAGDTVLRVGEEGRDLGPGSVITIEQNGTSDTVVVASVQRETLTPDHTTYRITLENSLTDGPYGRDPDDDPDITVTSEEFTLNVNGDAEEREHLSMARNNPRYFGTILAENPFNLITVQEADPPSNASLPERRPAETTPSQSLDPGTADTPQELGVAEYQDALDSLRDVDQVNFIAIPDSTEPAVQLALLTHCERETGDRFAIFDPPVGLSPAGPGDSIRDRVDVVRSARGYGALYYPRIRVPHPDGGLIAVPPSGHIAGIYALADTQQGVHKAPANYTLNGALGVTVNMDNATQGPLNLDGINVLRVFPDQARPVVWGARTTSTETAWQYVNIRRLLLFIEESIEEGIRWAVFEPNNLQLWAKLKRVITAFLTSVWRSGALFGETAEQAFYVRIDEVLNPPAERQLGRLYIEIGLRPTYPAEFIVIRIGFWPGGAEVTES